MATLFGIVTVAMVVAFGVGEDTDPLIDAGDNSSSAEVASGLISKATGELGLVDPASTRVTGDTSAIPGLSQSTSDLGLRSNYQDPISALEGENLESAVLLSAPSDPATPTTVKPTTSTAPPTTAAPDTTEPATTEAPPADTTDTTAVDGSSSTSETPATTEAPPTTADNGWVDSGNGVMVPSVLLAIRFCESTDNYQAANPSSSARGAYQFLTNSWAWYGHADRYGVTQAHLATPAQQDEAALITWQKDGTTPWAASRSCWG
ncbi:MAG: hypothetical protein GY724_11440 [Actinomycetia bacterium]|nr:hypothetical protein [Actinomycetes bacterium]MCP4228322.1 hypothetical protein [Actinomycetes bacterium]MCP5035778.1 hypothetical protein [Actinomycetes bacterium]